MKDKRDLAADPAGVAPIRPEHLAAKLAAIRNYRHPELLAQITANPRLVEMLWLLQATSLRPGGLLRFTEDLLAEFPERIGTPTMMKVTGKTCTAEQKHAIYTELPKASRPYIKLESEHMSYTLARDLSPEDVARVNARDCRALRESLKEIEMIEFREICGRAAVSTLPSYFAALCTEEKKGFAPDVCNAPESDSEDLDNSEDLLEPARFNVLPASKAGEIWFFHDIIGAIFEFMGRRAAGVQKRLAMTEVAKLIFDRPDYALAEKVMVRIEGASRFGKTEAMETWTEMRPGLARLVRVPCDNAMSTFFRRVGEALGIDCSYGSNQSRLKERVEYVIQHGGLFLVLDEAHFLIPQNYTAGTPPHRLNWVRTEIVDRRLPLALAVTPQAFRPAIDRFVKKTRYTMEQFFGRDFLPCDLPESLGETDLIAVARIHFPELGENALGYIANEARLSQNYLQAVEAIARRARFLASRRGCRVILRDIETAVSEVLTRRLPSTESPSQAPDLTPMGRPDTTIRPAPGSVVNGPLNLARRGTQPARMAAVSEPILDPSSLRSTGPVMDETEPVLVET